MSIDSIFRFSMPTEIIHGVGALKEVGSEAKKLGATRVLFLTDQGIKAAGSVQPALDSLEEQKIPVTLYDRCPPDPDTGTIEELHRILKESGCDCVAGAGGGSVLCAAKGVALVATNPGDIGQYRGSDKFRNPLLPCIAIPTTAGSGSEVSKNTIITDRKTHHKMAIAGFMNAPRMAVLDPLVLVSVPRGQAVASGVDALTHAIEALVARNNTSPLTDSLALSAIGDITANLTASILGRDIESLSKMMLAASVANIACGNTGLCLSHAMNGTITATYKAKGYTPVAYGDIHCICLPVTLEFNLPASVTRFAQMSRVMGIKDTGRTDWEMGKQAVALVREILATVGAPRRLPWGSLPHPEIEEMARTTIANFQAQNNPRRPTQPEMVSLFEKALHGWEP